MPTEDNSSPIQAGFDPRLAESASIDLETVFAEVLESDAPLVALGRPGEQIGAGRVTTSDDLWKHELQILADGALLLLVLPSPGASLQWEIEWVKLNHHLRKSLFVMPPTRSSFLNLPRRSQPVPWDEIWRTLRARLQAAGVELPAYEKGGMIFFLGEDGTVSFKAPLQSTLDPKWVARLVGDLLSDASRGMAAPKADKSH